MGCRRRLRRGLDGGAGEPRKSRFWQQIAAICIKLGVKKVRSSSRSAKANLLASAATIAVVFSGTCHAASTLKVTIPKRSALTPVQKLNREGVELVKKHHFQQAESAFLKAYLYDASDPFTLYNLGYVAELEGDLDRAGKFYGLASEQANDAMIDRSNVASLRGETLKQAIGGVGDLDLRVNQGNIRAMKLLADGRPLEAESVLRDTLTVDPNNAFTLNNLGVAAESQGDLDGAVKSYRSAADTKSNKVVVVTVGDASWRGKSVSEMAAANAFRVEQRIQNAKSPEAQASLLSLRGVWAINRNQTEHADQDFREAFRLDPTSAFSINNAGYAAEMNGDLETAQFYYERARTGQGANSKVGLASLRSKEGLSVLDAAQDSSDQVRSKISSEQAAARKLNTPVVLRRRDGSTVVEPTEAPVPSPPNTSPSQPQPQ